MINECEQKAQPSEQDVALDRQLEFALLELRDPAGEISEARRQRREL
jgi:hypothetical protein